MYEKKICVIGLWHLGCVYSACLARNANVVAYDPDQKTVESLRRGIPPIYEPGLNEEIADAVGKGRLSFASSMKEALESATVVWFTFDLPVGNDDKSDMSVLAKAYAEMLSLKPELEMIIVSSQVPVGTCRKLLKQGKAAGVGAPVCYIPENLRLGKAIECFFGQERLVLGVSDDGARAGLEKLLEKVPGERMYMDLESAEMSKHAMNAYLAMMVSFSGEISDICESCGANAARVMETLRKERRVSPNAPLMPGLGFGGGTLARDVQALREAGKRGKARTFVLDATMDANEHRKSYVTRRLEEALGKLEGKNISFLGITYKAGTNTLRRSFVLDMVPKLKQMGVRLKAYDPFVKMGIDGLPELEVCQDVESLFKGADAVVLATPWKDFAGLDFARLCSLMRTPVIIDGTDALSKVPLGKGIKCYRVGMPYGKK